MPLAVGENESTNSADVRFFGPPHQSKLTNPAAHLAQLSDHRAMSLRTFGDAERLG